MSWKCKLGIHKYGKPHISYNGGHAYLWVDAHYLCDYCSKYKKKRITGYSGLAISGPEEADRLIDWLRNNYK